MDCRTYPITSAGWVWVSIHLAQQERAWFAHGHIKAVHACFCEHSCRTIEAGQRPECVIIFNPEVADNISLTAHIKGFLRFSYYNYFCL